MKKFQIVVIILLFNIGIACNGIHERLSAHSWIIKKISYESDENLILRFEGNSILISGNKSCVLPILPHEEFYNYKGKCDYFKRGNRQYIYFYETENKYFKDTFEVVSIDKDNINLVNKNKLVKLINSRVGWDANNYYKGIH